jgi:CubicO group peptidase (beta-lactamase class C family)
MWRRYSSGGLARVTTSRTILCVLVLCIAIPTTLLAQPAGEGPETARIRQVVDQYMNRLLATNAAAPRRPGAIVGISLHGKRYFFHYGTAKDDGMPFTPETLVEIGSCTKVFTTTLFALAINRGQIDPNASADAYMPKGYHLRGNARKMTPVQLADFTSGMPDDPTNLPHVPLERRGIEFYTVKDFMKWVAGRNPATPPPAPYFYSNSGIGLLSYLVDTATNAQWQEQVNTQILGPLGMRDTELRPSDEQRQRLARGHHANGTDAPPWPVFAWYAAGGLRSTAADMLRFGEANLGHKEVDGRPVSDELIAAMNLAQKPRYMLPSGKAKQAMAWVQNVGTESDDDSGDQPRLHPEMMKNGGTVGFSSAIVLNHYKDAAIFIAVNWSGHNPAPTAVAIGRHLP